MKNLIMGEGKIGEFRYKILMGPMGFINGYVGIPSNTFDAKMDYEDKIRVHGGITFQMNGEFPKRTLKMDGNGKIKYFTEPVLFEAPFYWVGFDTGHYQDGIDVELASKYYDGNKLNSIKRMAKFCERDSLHIWTKDEVFQEILEMVKQLEELENEVKS